MKKIFSFLLLGLLLSIGNAWGTTVTFSYADYKGQGTSGTGSEYTMVKTDVSITNSKFYCSTSYSNAQFYAGGVSTITPSSGVTITGIELTASSNSYNGYQNGGTITASSGSVALDSEDDTKVIWTGSSSSAFTLSNTKQIRWTTIVVTYTTGGAPQPSITVSTNSIEAPAAGADGTINVTYNNITDVAAEVYFCNAAGTEAATYDWVDADINASNNVEYLIEANTGAARTAYMKVYALDDATNDVYSEIITISQAEYVEPAPASTALVTWDMSTNIFTFPEGSGNKTVTATDYTYGGYTVNVAGSTGDGYYWHTDGYLLLGKNGATFTFPAFDFNVSKIKIYGRSAASGKVTFNMFVGADAVSTAVTSSKEDHEFEIAADKQGAGTIYTLKVTNANNCQIVKIEVFGYYELTLGANGYSTYAADFSYEVDGANAYKAKYQNGAIVLTQVNVIEAGEGIVLKGANAGDVVTITPSNATADDFSDNELVGVLTPTLAQANWYVLATDLDHDGLTKFHACQAGIEIPANKAYMVIGEATAPSIRIIEAENNATNIQNLEGSEKAVKFIENGKLYIKKNGVIYNAVGAVVR